MAAPLEELRRERIKKLENLRQRGVDPFPSGFEGTRLSVGDLREKGLGVSGLIAGRLRSLRRHGKIVFADLEDQSGRVQVVFKQDRLEKAAWELLGDLDVGDILAVEGVTFETKAGEFSLLAEKLQLLTKSLRPLPSAWFGFRNLEERSRRRYLDLLMNEEVRQTFVTRSRVLQLHREFLLSQGYLEVETPVLQPLYGGTLARPFKTYHNVLGIPLYLRISTELYLKRLIVGGFEKVFEIAHVFRNEGIDRNHNPEFTILETMEAYIDYRKNMDLVEKMTEYVVVQLTGGTVVDYQGHKIDFKAPWKRLTMVEAVKEETGVDFSRVVSVSEALKLAGKHQVPLEAFNRQSVGMILAAFFEEKVEKTLIQPTIIYDFPVETSPLAKKCPQNPQFVERFEHFVAGMECSNNYSELNDPLELAKRFRSERRRERLGDEEAHQTDQDFIEALEYGMPPTSGIGPGMDRLVMILTNKTHLRDVILFPTRRPRSRRPVGEAAGKRARPTSPPGS